MSLLRIKKPRIDSLILFAIACALGMAGALLLVRTPHKAIGIILMCSGLGIQWWD